MSKKQTASVISTWGSFTIVPNEVLESDLSARAVLVFVALMSRVSHDSAAAKCWPSYEAIAERCAIKARASINAALDELEAKGFLKRDKRFSASTVYTLMRPAIASSSQSELMVDAPVVHNVNDSSSQCELSEVQNVNANKIQRTRHNEQDSTFSIDAQARDGESASPAVVSVVQEETQTPEIDWFADDAPVAQPQPEIDWFADDPAPAAAKPVEAAPVAEAETDSQTVLKRVRRAKRALDEHEAKRHQELFSGIARICVLDPKLRSCAGQIARTAKELREADASATDATMTEFLEWWKTSDFRGKMGKPPTPQQVVTSWKLFRENYAEMPATGGKSDKGDRYFNKITNIYTEALNG